MSFSLASIAAAIVSWLSSPAIKEALTGAVVGLVVEDASTMISENIASSISDNSILSTIKLPNALTALTNTWNFWIVHVIG